MLASCVCVLLLFRQRSRCDRRAYSTPPRLPPLPALTSVLALAPPSLQQTQKKLEDIRAAAVAAGVPDLNLPHNTVTKGALLQLLCFDPTLCFSACMPVCLSANRADVLENAHLCVHCTFSGLISGML